MGFEPSPKPSAGSTQFVLRQYDPGAGDYTEERRSLLPDWDASTLIQKASELQSPRKA